MDGTPHVSVVVASHGRHLRLRWLMNALEEQTLPRNLWEVLVVHDYDSETARRAIMTHALYGANLLRQIAIPPGTGSPARQRNLGWRAARGPLIAFTDDDCRPEPEWLEALMTASADRWETVIQGATRPDPWEKAILAAPHVRTMLISPVGPYAQTCNILYPRRLLQQLNGFDEHAITGEDVDLSLRARALGASIEAAPRAIVNHAVEAFTMPGILRANLKWRHLAYVVKRHPELRKTMPMRVFWDGEHLRTSLLLLALPGCRRHRRRLLLAIPYFAHSAARRGPSTRRRVVAVCEIPGQAIRQIAEVAGLAIGSVRHRTPVL